MRSYLPEVVRESRKGEVTGLTFELEYSVQKYLLLLCLIGGLNTLITNVNIYFRNKSSLWYNLLWNMLPHEKRQRTFPKGIEESDDEVENMGEMRLLPGPRRTASLFDLRTENMKFMEYPGFGRSVSTLFLTSPSAESCKLKSACSEEHLPCSRPSSDSPRLERRSPGVGSSSEFPRPGPSTPDIGLSTETLWSGHSLSYAGPTSESLRPGPSSPHAASFSESGLRPTSPPPLHRSLFLQYLNQELMKQQLTSRGKAFLKSSAYFGQGPINLIPPNQVPPNQGIVNQKPPQGSPNKEPFNQEYAHQVSSNLMPLNQTTPTQAPSQTQEQEVNTMTDVQNFTFGLSLDIICNHVQLDLIPGKGVFEYNIEFFPQENNRFLRNQMIRQQEELLGDALFFSEEKLFLSTSSFEVCIFI
ncbi:Protein of unknown function [Gryllus bimaculatus]|nr:Protein of unknown function [Gryllus bimaculatus]